MIIRFTKIFTLLRTTFSALRAIVISNAMLVTFVFLAPLALPHVASDGMSVFLPLTLVESIASSSQANARGGGRGGGGFSRGGAASAGSFSARAGSMQSRPMPSTRDMSPSRSPAERPQVQQQPRAADLPADRRTDSDRISDREQHQGDREDAREDRQNHLDDAREDRQDFIDEELDDDWDDDDWEDVVAAGVVAAAVLRTLPCTPTTVVVDNVSYYQCGSTWYNQAYSGNSVTYVTVTAPSGY